MQEPLSTIELLTINKQDLFDVSATLALALEKRFLLDPKAPVVVAVGGSHLGGKKIIADSAREALLGTETVFTGKKGYDEYWTGKIDGADVEFDYIDIAYGEKYHVPVLSQFFYPDRETNFLKLRALGGISFMQNKAPLEEVLKHYLRNGELIEKLKDRSRDDLKVTPVDINIWVESPFFTPVYNDTEKPRLEGSALKKPFMIASAMPDSLWTRYVQIDVKDIRLLQSPVFQQALKKLSDSANQVAQALEVGNPFPADARPYQPPARKMA